MVPEVKKNTVEEENREWPGVVILDRVYKEGPYVRGHKGLEDFYVET